MPTDFEYAIFYTMDDDGVHLQCERCKEEHVEFAPSLGGFMLWAKHHVCKED